MKIILIVVSAQIYAEEVECCYNSKDTRGQKEAQEQYDAVASLEFLLFGIGLCQILERKF